MVPSHFEHVGRTPGGEIGHIDRVLDYGRGTLVNERNHFIGDVNIPAFLNAHLLRRAGDRIRVGHKSPGTCSIENDGEEFYFLLSRYF